MSQKPNFEKQMDRLRDVVAQLERGDLALEKSVLLYKEGQTLAVACRKQLEQARLAVTVREEGGVVPFSETDLQEEA